MFPLGGLFYICCNAFDCCCVSFSIWISFFSCFFPWFHCCFCLCIPTFNWKAPEIATNGIFKPARGVSSSKKKSYMTNLQYWPDPHRGIKEAYRVLRLGGKACIIGPVYPTFWLSRFFADVWMLFPKEEEYIEWFEKAGFKNVRLKRIGPKWYRGVRRHELFVEKVKRIRPNDELQFLDDTIRSTLA